MIIIYLTITVVVLGKSHDNYSYLLASSSGPTHSPPSREGLGEGGEWVNIKYSTVYGSAECKSVPLSLPFYHNFCSHYGADIVCWPCYTLLYWRVLAILHYSALCQVCCNCHDNAVTVLCTM